MDTWQEIADFLKKRTWDITEEWLEETKSNQISSQNYPILADEDVISDLPTFIGGIANVIEDPVFLEDLQKGGHIYALALEFGRHRQNNGYQINKVLSDYTILQQKIWSGLKNQAQLRNNDFFELERRVNSAMAKIVEATIESFHQTSSVELIELAYKDKLTGFLHLKALMNVIDDELNRSRRYHRSLSLAIIDIDNFRDYNLQNGRLAGNQLLQNIAREIIHIVRSTDKASRLGGDEFGILMPETTIEAAKTVAERIRRQVRQETLRNESMLTVSIGIASYPANAANREELLEESNLSLTQAQQVGGDNIWLSQRMLE